MFKLTFDFEDRIPEDLGHVNATLAALRLSDLKIEDSQGCLTVFTAFDALRNCPIGPIYDYGLDRLVLNCQDEKGEELHTYQLDVQALPLGAIKSPKAFHDAWCANNPNRIMRTLIHHSYDDADVFVVLHHEGPVAR